MNRRRALQAVSALALRPTLDAQQDSQRALMSTLEVEAAIILKKAETELASKESWEPLRAIRRRELQDMLGLDPWPEKTPLSAMVHGTLNRDDYTVERLAFESIPKFFVTANFYLPRQRAAKVPVVLYVCGHSVTPAGAKTSYQRHGISFARNGYACLILDPVQISEVFALHHGVFGLQLYDWYARGYAPAGIEVWNAVRDLDWLEQHREVDMSRCAMTGRSGGAAMTWFTAALDDRIKAAAPIMGISTYLANIRENTQKGHCDCMFPINFHRHDMPHQGALIAPRPLLMGHGTKDTLFPIPGYTKCESMLKGLYSSYGHPERFRNVVVETGHQDSDYLREQVIRWFDTHLLQKERQPEMTYQNNPPESLTVFQGHPPEVAINPRIHFLYRPKYEPKVPTTRKEWEARKTALIEMLKAKVFHNLQVASGEPAIRLRAPEGEGKFPAILYIASSGDDDLSINNLFRLAGLPQDVIRMLVYPRDWMERKPKAVEYRDLLRNSMHVGTTPETIRLQDVLTAANRLLAHPKLNASRIVITGRAADAAIALYTAILDTRITDVLLMDPPESHTQGPIFLNVLRHTDLPETAALLTPRRLHFFHRTPQAYDLTRSILALEGQKMKGVYSLAETFEQT